MFKFYPKLLLFLLSYLFLDGPFNNFNVLKSEEYSEHNIGRFYSKENIKFNNNNYSFNNESVGFSKVLREDIFKFKNKLINLVAYSNESELDNSTLEIESDTQYEIDNFYYAEGNAIVYFSNALLKGDKIEYDKKNKKLKVIDNVVFIKGNQYFEASKVVYNLETGEGYIDNIYGILSIKSFVDDFEFKNLKEKNISTKDKNDISNLRYIDSANIGLVNDFEEDRKFNIKNIKFDIPSIRKWRYKSKKILLKDSILFSENILFTNDAINKPQFILRSKDFTAEIVDEKMKIVSRRSSIILDDILTIPIGKRTIFDKDPVSSWGIGSDYGEKDGFYISRGFSPIEINDNLSLKFEPYILLQRGIKGKTNAFTAPNSKLLSPKVKNNILFSDLFALDSELKANIKKWKLNINSRFNTLNTNRLSDAVRSKIILSKSINLTQTNDDFNLNNEIENLNANVVDLKTINTNDQFFEDYDNRNLNSNSEDINLNYENIKYDNQYEERNTFKNFLDFKFTSSFRDTITRGYSGEQEIYFGNSFSIANRRSWANKNRTINLAFISDLGKFKAKDIIEFNDLYRSVFATKFNYNRSLWKKKLNSKSINSDYTFSPSVIKQRVDWMNGIQSGIFLYSNGFSQKALSFTSGFNFVLGQFKKPFVDYTNINIRSNYVLKGGESPFGFDKIADNFRLNLNLEQQLYGPILFSYGTSYNFDNGKYSEPNYGLDIKRRAYSIGAFYNSASESLGIRFNIFNFDYSGISEKF